MDGHVEVVSMLLDRGASIEAKDDVSRRIHDNWFYGYHHVIIIYSHDCIDAFVMIILAW